MTQAEVAKLLAKCAAYDQRTVGEADVLAWHEILSRVDLADAFEAVRRHYAASRDRVMPADIVKLSRTIRDERRDAHEIRELPSRFEGDVTRDLRLKAGVAHAREVLAPVLERLAAAKDADKPASSESDLIRERALEMARQAKRGRRA